MAVDKVGAKMMVDFLNGLLNVDREAIEALTKTRIPCNKAMAEHPTVQVGEIYWHKTKCDLGLVGLLNGFFGSYDDGPKKGWGGICYVEDDKTHKLLHFAEHENK